MQRVAGRGRLRRPRHRRPRYRARNPADEVRRGRDGREPPSQPPCRASVDRSAATSRRQVDRTPRSRPLAPCSAVPCLAATGHTRRTRMSRRLLSALLVALVAPPVAAHPLVPGRVALSLAPDASAPPAPAPLGAWAPPAGPSRHAPQDMPAGPGASPASGPPSGHVPEDISHHSDPSPAAHPPGTPPRPAPPSGHAPQDMSFAPSAPAPPALPPHLMRIRPAIDVPVIGLGLVLWLGSDLAAKDSSWAGCAASAAPTCASWSQRRRVRSA